MTPTSSASILPRTDRPADLAVAGVGLHADCAGVLYWADESLLVVADLHLEKGSSFARRGMLLPPYDTTETLARLARLIAHYAPRRVIALGDNFHDGGGPSRLSAEDRTSLGALQRWRDGLTFRHEPSRNAPDGEIAGHLHPQARIAQRGRAVSRRCFVTDGQALVMPAFGAYTGGLNIRDRAFTTVFGTRGYTAHMLGDGRLYAFAASRCLSD
jgi:metallophosphoesterase superfamily enzyme